MVYIIESIDAICRRREKDLLYLAFIDDELNYRSVYSDVSEVTSWLDEHGIGWEICTAFDREFEHFDGGPGAICLDVPFDAENEKFRILEEAFPDHPEVRPKEGFALVLMQIDVAKQYAYRDTLDC